MKNGNFSAGVRLETILTSRDQEKYNSWEAAKNIERAEKARMRAHTDKIRAKLENEREF